MSRTLSFDRSFACLISGCGSGDFLDLIFNKNLNKTIVSAHLLEFSKLRKHTAHNKIYAENCFMSGNYLLIKRQIIFLIKIFSRVLLHFKPFEVLS